MIKHNFDQTPILLENFDQLIRSSEIRSSDPLSKKVTFSHEFNIKNIRNLTVIRMTGGQLTEFHLTESVDRKFLIKQAFDQNCV